MVSESNFENGKVPRPVSDSLAAFMLFDAEFAKGTGSHLQDQFSGKYTVSPNIVLASRLLARLAHNLETKTKRKSLTENSVLLLSTG